MSRDDWEFIFELMLARPTQPQECWRLVEMLQTFPHDRAQRAVVADWFYEHGYDRCSKLIRRGYTPGGPCGPDLNAPTPSWMNSGSYPPVLSGALGSGQIGWTQITSGYFPMGVGCGSISMNWNPPPGTFASGAITVNQPTPPSGSVYEDLD